MADISHLDISMIQNLKDAGCSNEFIESQKRIDCLDYLIYKMKKSNH